MSEITDKSIPIAAYLGVLDERDRYAQALWDVYGILGFDQDDCPTPAAVSNLASTVTDAAKEIRADYDEACDELHKERALHDDTFEAYMRVCASAERQSAALRTLIEAIDTCSRATVPAMGLLSESRANDAAQ